MGKTLYSQTCGYVRACLAFACHQNGIQFVFEGLTSEVEKGSMMGHRALYSISYRLIVWFRKIYPAAVYYYYIMGFPSEFAARTRALSSMQKRADESDPRRPQRGSLSDG